MTHSDVCFLTNTLLPLLALWPIFKLFLVTGRVRNVVLLLLVLFFSPDFFQTLLFKLHLN